MSGLNLKWLLTVFVLSSAASCNNNTRQARSSGNEFEESPRRDTSVSDQYIQRLFYESLERYTSLMVEDIFSPPLAARSYAYAYLAAWEAYCLALGNGGSLALKLNNYSGAGESAFPEAHPGLCALLAFERMASELLFSSAAMDSSNSAHERDLSAILDHRLWQHTLQLSAQVLDSVNAYRHRDGYAASRSLPRYGLRAEPGFWRPTAPGYFDPVEPNWNRLQPFTLTSAQQFQPPPPSPYSSEKSSEFYRDMLEVYTLTRSLTAEQSLIANFWDCNPFNLKVQGHFNYSVKKISPGAHWIGIGAGVCRQEKLSFEQALWVQTVLSLTLHDAFISCWDEKYRSEYIRPETVIHQLLDQDWKPLLQTPPFPEYTSGHSVASNSAAVVLTKLFGDLAFTDSVEVPYGLPVRSFSSFAEAAQEASISRMYGGIHFRPAVEQGIWQGQSVGEQAAVVLGLEKLSN